MPEESGGNLVEIGRLGTQGDGVAETPGGPLFIPFALPGERWRIAQGRPPERVGETSHRQAPVCRHFGSCGGCVAQHMPDALYRRWKEQIVREAFMHRGLAAEPEALRVVAAGSRRRAFFGVARKGSSVVLGFRERGRHTLVDLAECPVLEERIVAVLPALRGMACLALPAAGGGRLIVTAADGGLDVAVESGLEKLGSDARAALATRAAEARLLRLSVNGDVVYMERMPTVAFGGVRVELPAGAFLQAVLEAEELIGQRVVAAVAGARRVADLFCGLGTLTFPLARSAHVLAVDQDRRAVAALEKAARRARGLKPVEIKTRDLIREPLSRAELAAFDAVVLDPPRAGAKAQVEALARGRTPRIVVVSCNPATLARDARILVDAGYRLMSLAPIDQFLFSPHVEAVAVFGR